jgi:hypothetical protein
VKQQCYDIASATVTEHLIYELSESRITQKGFFYSLFTKLRKFREEELLWSGERSLNEL